ncbi:MAG: hypothetical protein AB8B50_16580 [Pirellulaceae bacterium]
MHSKTTSRWRPLAAGLLCLNIAGVVGTSWWHLANAGETVPAADEKGVSVSDGNVPKTLGSNSEQVQVSTKLESDPNALNAEVLQASRKSGDQSPPADRTVGSLVPEDFPSHVPPEADADALEDDAVFQEIRKLFSSDDEQLLAAENTLSKMETFPPLAGQPAEALRIFDIERQTKRVAYAAQLAEVAQAMLADAHSELAAGNAKQANEIHGMATSLRIMAAKLLKAD